MMARDGAGKERVMTTRSHAWICVTKTVANGAYSNGRGVERNRVLVTRRQ